MHHVGKTNILGKYAKLLPIKSSRLRNGVRYYMPIGRQKFFNYNKTAKTFMIDEYQCKCEPDSPGYYEIIGHVITGDLGFIGDLEVRNIMCKGSKFWPPYSCSLASILKYIRIDLELFIINLSVKYSLPIAVFDEWRYHIFKDKKKL